jgi:hypothetical protein
MEQARQDYFGKEFVIFFKFSLTDFLKTKFFVNH